MIQVSVEVREGDAPFRVAVQAESIGLAVSTIEGHHPGSDVRGVFPIHPEGFFLAEDRVTSDESRRLRPLHEPSTRL